ncbi:sulfatase-like hydrolase/transferase [candidate division KSB1 bacterium]|nr:sulfatase-like hydrolase/transferase [candidate division KSB1 bacterium]
MPDKSEKMNILFIMSDSLVTQLTGFMNDQIAETPNLDKLAASGVLFNNAYCNSPLCAPSRASMVTGRYVSEIGAFDNSNEFSSEIPTMGHVFHAAGYESVIIGKMHFLGYDQWHGFDQRLALSTDYSRGYSPGAYVCAYQWDQPSGPNPAPPAEWMGPSYVRTSQWDHYPHHYQRDEEIHKQAIAYLSSKNSESEPFFCCVSYHAPHNPFWIPPKYLAPFQNRTLLLPSIPEDVNPCHGIMDKWLNDFHRIPEIEDRLMHEDSLQWLYETYYGIVHYLDERIGELLNVLRQKKLDRNTAIVFASDHGDMLAHRGMVQKRYFYDRSMRVALIFSLPNHWREDVRIETPVSLLDLLPTFTELLDGQLPDELPGRSVLSSLRGDSEPENRMIFAEYHGEGVHAPCFMALKDQYKYIYVHGHEERLYNLEQDPDEFQNLITDSSYSNLVAELKAAVFRQFNPDAIAEAAIRSQRNRRFILNSVGKNQ